jgi:uncharacterized protein
MQHSISFQLLPSEAEDSGKILKKIAHTLSVKESAITGFNLIKKSIDARGKIIKINVSVIAFVNEPFYKANKATFNFKQVSSTSKKVIIIGAGPAGLFAALQLIEKGIQPIIVERGKEVRARRRDLATLNKNGVVNGESNYCFGEGGAGTYSDGKLYTRSNKRGDIDKVLQLFVAFGADEKILYEAHPHIGTNKLPQIITAMRLQIINCGGIFLFEKKVIDFVIDKNKIIGVKTLDGDVLKAHAIILATGHSARDIFALLHQKNILIEAKPFALGVRIEHPQMLIDSIQYHCQTRDENLPPAPYSLVQQVNGKGVFSFCMCPGGIIAPASTSPGELVVNGWSPSKRNNEFANSGMVVEVTLAEILANKTWGIQNNALAFMQFQQMVEQQCFAAGGGNLVAPAQRMVDFSNNNFSNSLPKSSYIPGLQSTSSNEVLPTFIHQALAKAFIAFGKKMKGFFTNEAVVVATESRTSSPVRIPRDKETLVHPQIINLYPCGEGAGYAGGIVSAAMDGQRVANQIAAVLQ